MAGKSCTTERFCLIQSLRQQFNASWSPDKYERFLRIIEQRTGEPTRFRHSETPCFFPAGLIAQMSRYGREMVESLIANEQYRITSGDVIPPRYRVPHESPHPLFVQADFGLDEQLRPKLVEIQGFPSLYAYQTVLAQAYREAYNIDSSLPDLPAGLTHGEYWSILRRAIVGGHDAEQVILLEVDPDHQKTRGDF